MVSNSSHIRSTANNIYINSINKNNLKIGNNTNYTPSNNDKIILSDESQNFAVYLNKLGSTPEIRTEKVNLYSEKINNNNYTVDAGNIAEKILNGCFI